MLTKLNHSSRLLKWLTELSEFDISNSPRITIKAQLLTDFFVNFGNSLNINVSWLPLNELYIEDSLDEQSMNASIVFKLKC